MLLAEVLDFCPNQFVFVFEFHLYFYSYLVLPKISDCVPVTGQRAVRLLPKPAEKDIINHPQPNQFVFVFEFHRFYSYLVLNFIFIFIRI